MGDEIRRDELRDTRSSNKKIILRFNFCGLLFCVRRIQKMKMVLRAQW